MKAALPNGKLLLELSDTHDWLGGYSYAEGVATPAFEAPASAVKARQRGGVWTEVPPVDYSADWAERRKD